MVEWSITCVHYHVWCSIHTENKCTNYEYPNVWMHVMDLHNWMYACVPVWVSLCICVWAPVKLSQAGRQADCVIRWHSKSLYVCVCVCMEQVCLAALHSLLPICAPFCVPPVPTLCQQHYTIARRPRRMGCWEMRGGMESKQEMQWERERR